MSILEYMIINDRGKQHKYMINTQVAIHVQEDTIARILKYHSDEAVIDFIEIC